MRRPAGLAGAVLVVATSLAPVPHALGAGGEPGWSAQPSGTTVDLGAVSFADAATGSAVGMRGTIVTTTDGGRTWATRTACLEPGPCVDASPTRVTADLAGVSRPTRDHGVAVGRAGTILATNDGGRSWTPQSACRATNGVCSVTSPDRVTVDLAAVALADPFHGFVVGAGGTILATTDGGRTWARQIACSRSIVCSGESADLVVADLAAVAVADRSHAYAVGAGGTILFTRNGGRTWQATVACSDDGHCDESSPQRIRADLTAVAVADWAHAFAVGTAGTFVATTNGLSWKSRPACPAQACTRLPDLAGIAVADAWRGRVVGAEGFAASFGPGQEPSPGAPDPGAAGRPDLRAVSMPEANVAFAVGAGGTVVTATRPGAGVEVSAVEPRAGPTAGSQPVVVRGQGFTGATAVTFGRTLTTRLTVRSDRELAVVPPLHAAGDVGVAVTTPAGTSGLDHRAAYRYAEPVGGQWAPAASCQRACRSGTAVLLHTGEVLAVASGAFFAGGSERPTAVAEVYDPVTRGWRPTGSLAEARRFVTATVLADGRVLVVGGHSAAEQPLASAELFDPATRVWEPAGSLSAPRLLHTATLLADGRVLVAGGVSGSRPAPLQAELFDPSTRRWSATGGLAADRSSHTATLLDDGRVLAVGGYSSSRGSGAASAELYDPGSGQWSTTTPPAFAHVLHTATKLADGRVLVVAGSILGQASSEAELYEPVTGHWSRAASLAVPRLLHRATLLPDGRVLVTGGALHPVNGPVVAFVEAYDPGADHWSLLGSMARPRDYHGATLLAREPCGDACGKVLVSGGTDCRYCLDPTVPSAELFTGHPVGSPAGTSAKPGRGSVAWAAALAATALAGAFAAAVAVARRRVGD